MRRSMSSAGRRPAIAAPFWWCVNVGGEQWYSVPAREEHSRGVVEQAKSPGFSRKKREEETAGGGEGWEWSGGRRQSRVSRRGVIRRWRWTFSRGHVCVASTEPGKPLTAF